MLAGSWGPENLARQRCFGRLQSDKRVKVTRMLKVRLELIDGKTVGIEVR